MTEFLAHTLERRVENHRTIERLVGKRRLRLVWKTQDSMLTAFVAIARDDLMALTSIEGAHFLNAEAEKLLRKELPMQERVAHAFRHDPQLLEPVIDWFVEHIPQFLYCHVGHSLRMVPADEDWHRSRLK